jgi:hypothetical protein
MYIFSSNTHTNPIARRAVVCFQWCKKFIQQPKETHHHLYVFMDVPDKPSNPKEVELTEESVKLFQPIFNIFHLYRFIILFRFSL